MDEPVSNIQAYEANLQQRLGELRKGDPAFEANFMAVLDGLAVAYDGVDRTRRLLDVGCGLGFLARKLAGSKRTVKTESGPDPTTPMFDITAIDSSALAIEMAKREHAGVENITFLAISIQDFAAEHKRAKEELFDDVISAMVFHSMDDDEVRHALGAIKTCMHPAGRLIVVAPGDDWVRIKLVEYAFNIGMGREETVQWASERLSQNPVELQLGTGKRDAYDQTVRVYQRTPEAYGSLFLESGFGFDEIYRPVDEDGQVIGDKIQIQHIGCYDLGLYSSGQAIKLSQRRAFVTQQLLDG